MLKYSLWVEIKLYQLSSSFCVSLCEKIVYDILFNFTLVEIMTFNFILKSQHPHLGGRIMTWWCHLHVKKETCSMHR